MGKAFQYQQRPHF